MLETRPVIHYKWSTYGNQLKSYITIWCAPHFKYLQELISLKRHMFLGIHFLFFAFEYWTKARQLCQYTAGGPDVDRLVIVLGTKEQLRSAIPDGYYHSVADS